MTFPRARFRVAFPVVLGALWVACLPAFATSLKQMYDSAPPGPGYDREIVLQTGVTYTGGLWMGKTFNRIAGEFEGPEEDVRIVGNGAVIDLQGGSITFAYNSRRLDIEDCVILNGDVVFRGFEDATLQLVPQGSVRYVTFYKPQDYGVRLFGCGAGILIERNLVVDAVDTGGDFMFLTGELSPWLATGSSFSLSNESGVYDVFDNWSYHSIPFANTDPQRHFSILCDYG